MNNGWSLVFRKNKNLILNQKKKKKEYFFDTFSYINFITNIKYVQIKEKI